MTGAMSQEISEQLQRLAALIRAPLLGETAPAGAVDSALADFAVRRHRVGPLLQAALRTADFQIEPAVADMLAQQYRVNAIRYVLTDAFLKDLARKFRAADIPWLAFKGILLARQLYIDPAWRHCHDVDVLVPPRMHAKATQILESNGFSVVNTQLSPEHWLERASAAIAKDVMLSQPKSGIRVELHRRLLFGRTEEKREPLLRDAFQPRLGLTDTDIPTAPVGAGFTLYLLLHGASSRWFRLKWLVDLVPLARRIDAAQVHDLATAARRLRAETTVKAGLMLLRRVFGDLSNDALQAWLDEPAGRDMADARAQTYLSALDRARANQGNIEGNRFDSLNLYYSMMDNPGYRAAVLLRGGAWTVLRVLAATQTPRTNR